MDAVDICPILYEEYDDDPSINGKSSSHLPVQSAKCPHRMCYSCVIKLKMEKATEENKDPCDIKWLECPECRIKTCFNTENPVVDLSLCNALRIIRSSATLPPAATSSSSGSGGDATNLPEINGRGSDNEDAGEDECHSDEESRFSTMSEGEVIATPCSSNPARCDASDSSYVGHRVSKCFHGRIFHGTIDRFDEGGRLWHVQYDDGDEEELEHGELLGAIDLYDGGKRDAGEEDDILNAGENGCTNGQSQSLNAIPQSCLISRRQLHCLTGGKQGTYPNPLGVATPMNHCGAASLATKDGMVHHLCVKEKDNHPLPKLVDERFLFYRWTKKGRGPLVRDVQLLVDHPDHPPIPIFWEPIDQEGTNVIYVGHWKVANVDDFSSNPIEYMGYLRCALVTLKFIRFDQRWAGIMQMCQDRTPDEIISMTWDDGIGGGDVRANATTAQSDSIAESIPHSHLISRTQLHCLTGGKVGGYINPLNVATAVSNCGKGAGTKCGKVHHYCIKEEKNHPIPKFVHEDFLLYRTTGGTGLKYDIQLLIDSHPNHPLIPIFWEPEDQEKTNVMYIGHWKVASVDDFSSSPLKYKGELRCALVKLKFVRFDQRWARIIQMCHDKSPADLRAMNLDEDGHDGGRQALEGSHVQGAGAIGQESNSIIIESDRTSVSSMRGSKRKRLPSKRYERK